MSTKKVLQVRTRKGKKKTHQHVENETNNIVTCLIHKYGNMDQEYWIQNAMLCVATQHNELNTHTKKTSILYGRCYEESKQDEKVEEDDDEENVYIYWQMYTYTSFLFWRR